jgi:plasmid stabilization system protein ParE
VNELFRIAVDADARRQIRELNLWWWRNRTAAPNAVTDELTRIFRLLINQPRIGPVALEIELPGVRRILLSRIGHYLYYRVLESEGVVQVLAIWSASRGEPPSIR